MHLHTEGKLIIRTEKSAMRAHGAPAWLIPSYGHMRYVTPQKVRDCSEQSFFFRQRLGYILLVSCCDQALHKPKPV